MVLVPKEPPAPIRTMRGPFLAPQHSILHLCLDLCNLTMTKLPDSSCMADLSEFFLPVPCPDSEFTLLQSPLGEGAVATWGSLMRTLLLSALL